MNDEYGSLSTKKLKKLIKQTNETLKDLKVEMAKRKLGSQHSEIDHLEDHLEEAEHGFTNFINFLKDVIKNKK